MAKIDEYVSATQKAQEDTEIPVDEQWRIIDQSGVLRRVAAKERESTDSPKSNTSQTTRQQEEPSEDAFNPFCEEIFNSILMIIPFTFLLLLMDV